MSVFYKSSGTSMGTYILVVILLALCTCNLFRDQIVHTEAVTCPVQCHQKVSTSQNEVSANHQEVSTRPASKAFGMGELSYNFTQRIHGENFQGVYDDLRGFTGLSAEELQRRLERRGHFHFAVEHDFWNPTSRTELTWTYRTSVGYLFGNAIHPVVQRLIDSDLRIEDGPILDYSGGVGNNVMYLARKGIEVYYFGIGEQEASFMKYRLKRHGLDHMVTVIDPFTKAGGTGVLQFDPIRSVPNKQYGYILAFDVLEHIPDYHITLEHLKNCVRPGGYILEQSPFNRDADDLSIHQKASIPLEEAMKPFVKDSRGWKKPIS